MNKKLLALEMKKRQTYYRERIRKLTLMDDILMSKVFEDPACAEYLLRVILEREDLTVTSVQSQFDIKNLQGRSVRLDILATDAHGKLYNVEVQRENEGAIPKRARYNSSMLDANSMDPGINFSELRETYIIFITERDVLRGGLPIYHINRYIEETGAVFGDEAHIVYVNASYRDDTPLGQLMQDFHCEDTASMHSSVLAERTGDFKKEQKGDGTMSDVMKEIIEFTMQSERRVANIETAMNMLREGNIPHEVIARCTSLTLEEVEMLAEELAE